MPPHRRNSIPVRVEDGIVRTHVSGPDNPIVEGTPEMRLPFEVRLPGRGDGACAELAIDGRTYPLPVGEFTPWVELRFRAGLGISVRGIARFYLKRVEPHFQLYMTPINVDPERPALPVSHPFAYSVYLSKTLGRFSTLGLAEDTWGLNERALDEGAFLKLAWLVHEERERMFFDALEKTEFTSTRLVRYRERFEPWALAAFLLVVGGVLVEAIAGGTPW